AGGEKHDGRRVCRGAAGGLWGNDRDLLILFFRDPFAFGDGRSFLIFFALLARFSSPPAWFLLRGWCLLFAACPLPSRRKDAKLNRSNPRKFKRAERSWSDNPGSLRVKSGQRMS